MKGYEVASRSRRCMMYARSLFDEEDWCHHQNHEAESQMNVCPPREAIRSLTSTHFSFVSFCSERLNDKKQRIEIKVKIQRRFIVLLVCRTSATEPQWHEQTLEGCNFHAIQSMNMIKYKVSGFRQCAVQSCCSDNGSTISHRTIQGAKYESAKAKCTALKHYYPRIKQIALKDWS